MPDAVKFKVLRDIGYTIPVTCGLCLHGAFRIGREWGTCPKHEYQHGKLSWWLCQMPKGCEGRPEMATKHTNLSFEARELRKELRQAAHLLRDFRKVE